MKLKDSTIKELDKLSKTNPHVKDLLDFYTFVSTNPVYESYVARMVTMNKWNEELIKNPVSILTSKTNLEDKTDKEVERVKKYFLEQPQYLKGTTEIRAMLTPDEQDSVNKDKRIKASPDLAFG